MAGEYSLLITHYSLLITHNFIKAKCTFGNFKHAPPLTFFNFRALPVKRASLEITEMQVLVAVRSDTRENVTVTPTSSSCIAKVMRLVTFISKLFSQNFVFSLIFHCITKNTCFQSCTKFEFKEDKKSRNA